MQARAWHHCQCSSKTTVLELTRVVLEPVSVVTHFHPDAQAENRRDKAEARGLTGGILVDLSHSSRTELRARKRITKCAQCEEHAVLGWPSSC